MINIVRFIWKRLSLIGTIPLCNGLPERAMHIGDFCFPLCYRCMFIVMMFFMILFIAYVYHKKVNLFFAVCMLVPMVIDGCLQTFMGVESTNIRRAITGALFGIGLGTIVSYIHLFIDQRTLK